MSPSTDVAQRTPAQDLVTQLRDPRTRDQLAMALPPSITVDKFVRVMTAAIITNPEIATLERNSVFTSMVRAAADGLIPDGKEAAIVGRKGKATYVPMIGGYRRIAGEHGWSLRTAVVYAEDEFDHAVIDGEEKIMHRPVRPGAERGELIAAYAIATHRDGRRMQVVLHPDDVAKRRASASTQNVWNEHPAAMWEKSAGRDLFAQLPLADSDLVARVLNADVEPDEATTALYGPRQIAATTETAAAAAASPGNGGEISQQAGDAHPPRDGTPRAEEASPAPGEDEPDLVEPRPAQLNDDEQAAIEAAANEAAIFTLDRGKHRDKTLGEIAQIDGSDGWFVWGLRQTDLPVPMSAAIWNFCRIYKPELFQQVLAEREAAAA